VISPPLLLALLIVGVLAVLFSKTRQKTLEAQSNVLPLTGKESGTLETYFARIESLSRTATDGFFVTAAEPDSPRFFQVSVGRGPDSRLAYQFDMPILDWSRALVVLIEAEAKKRGLGPVRDDPGGMNFLNIDFPTSGDHAIFVRWVAKDVFRLAPNARLEINWG